MPEAPLKRMGSTGVWLGQLGVAPAALAARAVSEIEALGYAAVWLGEGPWTKESFSSAGLVLAATERIAVGTGIANLWVRDATAMNAAAQTLAEAYPGRFVLGLGVSHAPQVDPRGHHYRRPVDTVRAYLDAMEAAGYRGALPPSPVPRVLAALRPRMLELARERTDGAHTFLVTPEHTSRARALLGPAPLLVPEQAVVLETDPAAARAAGREHLALFLRLPNYVASLRWMGFGDEDLSGGGSDRLVDAIVAWGDPGAVARRVRDHHEAGATQVAVFPLAGDLEGAVGQLRVLAPLFELSTAG